MNIIGDVAGEFNTLMDFLRIMPDEEVVFVGDIIDRGSESNLVVKWVREHGISVCGNHEDYCIDYIRRQNRYRADPWLKWGGRRTLSSYRIYRYDHIEDAQFLSDVKWMESLPTEILLDAIEISHAARSDRTSREKILGNRLPPIRSERFQVFGHLGMLERFGDYAICIDDSRNRKLTGFNFPRMQLYSVPIR